MSEPITQERLKALLNYDAVTGVFTWRVNVYCGPYMLTIAAHEGDVAGCLFKNDYWVIRIDQRNYLRHRLAWLYVTGKYPESNVDHINRTPGDDRFCNLRLATCSENQRNSKRRSDNTSGVKGVGICPRSGKWRGRVKVNGKEVLCRIFETVEDAAAAVRAARELHHGQFACHG